MAAKHPMSAALRAFAHERHIGFATEKQINDAAEALDAMQARCDALYTRAGDFMNCYREPDSGVIDITPQGAYVGTDPGGTFRALADAMNAERARREGGS